MSAEIEGNTKEEDVQPPPPPKPLHRQVIENWQIVAKLVQLLLCVVCTALIVEPAEKAGMGSKYIHHIFVIFTAFTGYMVIIGVMLVSRSIGDRMPFRTSAIFSIVGSALFLTSATLLLADRAYLTKNYIFHPNKHLMDMMVWSGVFSIINAVVLAIDAIFTYRKQQNF